MHSESFFSTKGARVFKVKINGVVTSANVDVFSQVGMNAALILRHRFFMSQPGTISISFEKVKENPLVNGIKVTGCSGTVTPSPSVVPDVLDEDLPECSTGDVGYVLRMNAGGRYLQQR